MATSGTIITLAFNDSATTRQTQVTWQGGTGQFSVEATWGGGSVALQYLTPNNTWIAVGPDTTFTANGTAGFVLPFGTQIRALVTTATAVYAYIVVL